MAQIRGVVVDVNRLPVESVHIKNISSGNGVVSDERGCFQIKGKSGDMFEFHHINYQSFYLSCNGMILDTIVLKQKDFSIDEINVTSTVNPNFALSSIISIKRVPSFLGEPDIIKYLGTLPGVTSLGMLDAGIYVRGGNSSQNAYLVNGNPVADPQHIAGLLSTFDPYILNHSRFYKSGYPSKYNGFLSSYIDMKPVAYLNEDINMEASLGLLSSSVKAKIKPDKRKKSLLALSFRQSYFQFLAGVYNKGKESNEQLPSYSFNDLTLSYSFPVLKDWEVSLFGLTTADNLPMNFGEGFDYGLKWGTFSGSACLKGKVSKSIKSCVSLGYNAYRSDVDFDSRVSSTSKNKTEQLNINAGFEQEISSQIHLNYGLKTSLKRYNYRQVAENTTNTEFLNRIVDVYLEGNWRLGDRVKLTSGAVASSYLNDVREIFIMPRFKVNYNHNTWSSWIDYTHTMQFEERMNIFTVQSPVDIWLPVQGKLPSLSRQISIGSRLRLSNRLTASLGMFYKRLDDTKEFETYNRVDLSESMDKMISGEGVSVGGEVDFEYNTSKFYSRLNYTISHVQVRFNEINNGAYFDPPYDVRHNVLYNASVKLSKAMNLNVLWTFKSGVTATVPSGVAVAKDIGGSSSEFIPVYENRYNYRMPSTHRLDLNLEYLKKYNKNMLKVSVGAYNVYNQQNPSFVFVQAEAKDDYFIKFKLNSKVIFPFMPYFSVSYYFSKNTSR